MMNPDSHSEATSSLDDAYGSDEEVDGSTVTVSDRAFLNRQFVSWRRVREIASTGSSSIVYEVVTSDGSKMAVKDFHHIPGSTNYNRLMTKYYLQEVKILKGIRHKNIIDFFGNDELDEKKYIFLQLMNSGSLSSIYKKERIDERRASYYVKEILQALAFLHGQNIVHRDVKGANILVDINNQVRLADFGSAKEIVEDDLPVSFQGSYRWMAPEIAKMDRSPYGTAVDVWSLGCTLIELLSRDMPYGTTDEGEVITLVRQREKPPLPHNISAEATDFINACLRINPEERPTCSSLLNHRFIN